MYDMGIILLVFVYQYMGENELNIGLFLFRVGRGIIYHLKIQSSIKASKCDKTDTFTKAKAITSVKNFTVVNNLIVAELQLKLVEYIIL